jgi:hypothetical protein
LECAIKIYDDEIIDLSEQYLVSCNTDGWGCQGGFFAHDYHQWKPGQCDNEPGAVLDHYFPYVAQNVPCITVPHHYFIDEWHYLQGREVIPSVQEIKYAIENYGPVSVAVFADSNFQAYSGGIFDHESSGSRNHAVVLVGYKDDSSVKNGGYWILRNSWGSGWGENGYMRIAYGVHSVGTGASYIIYSGSDGPPDPPDPPPPPPPESDEYILKMTICEITNDDTAKPEGFEPIDPSFDSRGGRRPEWYYRVDFQCIGDSAYEIVYNKDANDVWISEHTWTCENTHEFQSDQDIVKISIKLMDDDNFGYDIADICEVDDRNTFIGYFNATTNTFDPDRSDPFIIENGSYSTLGYEDNNAKVIFTIVLEEAEGKSLLKTGFAQFFNFLRNFLIFKI